MSRQRSSLALLAAASMSVALGCASTTSSDAAPSGGSGDGEQATLSSSPTTDQRTLSRVRQNAALLMHPQIAHTGKGDAKAKRAKSGMTAQLRPVRKGRSVLLQRKKGSGWDTVSKGRENGRGRVDFTAPYKRKGKIQTYRVVAPRTGSLGKVTSPGVKTSKWGGSDFIDEFTGPALDLTKWQHQLQGYQPTSKRSCSMTHPAASNQGAGVVKVAVTDDPTRGADCRHGYEGDDAPYNWRYNGHIQTQGKYAFTYGYAAARMKFNPRRGQHGSFFLWPEPGAAPPPGSAKNTGAEIDVIEWFGKDRKPSPLTSFIYYYPDADGQKVPDSGAGIPNLGRYGKDWHRKYHVFSVEWTPRKYVFRIDGKETFRTSRGVSGQPEYLNLSNLASDYELKFLDGTDAAGETAGDASKLPQRMSVDWVRVWDRKR